MPRAPERPDIVRSVWGLIFPARCLGCDGALGPGDHGALCPACRRALPRLVPPLCAGCGIPATEPGRCGPCREDPPLFDAARAALPYEPLVRDLVLGFKVHGMVRLRGLFAGLMVEAFRAGGQAFEADAVGGVPMWGWDQRRRGRNHAAELAAAVARRLRLPHRPMLRKVRRTEPQAEMERARRGANVRGAFQAGRRGVVPARYLLVDDVLTTGATADACAAALKAAGVAWVGVLTLARTLPGER